MNATTSKSSRRPFSGSTARARQRKRRNPPPRVSLVGYPSAFLNIRTRYGYSRVRARTKPSEQRDFTRLLRIGGGPRPILVGHVLIAEGNRRLRAGRDLRFPGAAAQKTGTGRRARTTGRQLKRGGV